MAMKKGVYFTLMSIIIVAGLLFFFDSQARHSYEEKSQVIQTRILTMNSFIDDIEHDIERGLFISSMRSLLALSEHISEQGTFVTDFDAKFHEVMANGTINGEVLNVTEDAHFGEWVDKVTEVGNNLGVYVNISQGSIIARHIDPWNIEVQFSGNLILEDRANTASWDHPLSVSTVVEITEFEDPLYVINTSGKFSNVIIRSNITDYVSGSDASNLIEHVNNSWYTNSTRAPSFLMRFQGNYTASPFGIESFIHLENLQDTAPEFFDPTRSAIDFVYFGNASKPNCQLNQTADDLSWVRLDDDHLADYESFCI